MLAGFAILLLILYVYVDYWDPKNRRKKIEQSLFDELLGKERIGDKHYSLILHALPTEEGESHISSNKLQKGMKVKLIALPSESEIKPVAVYVEEIGIVGSLMEDDRIRYNYLIHPLNGIRIKTVNIEHARAGSYLRDSISPALTITATVYL